ncbi:MAG: transglycosylase domain-containing protein, partial [Actinomycetota bacterium]|nr:transglycosylase domain-containing protein [Actinomycetota bacterium]
MSQPSRHSTRVPREADVIPLRPQEPAAPPPTRTRIKKLRLLALLTGLGVLAGVSTAFGMMMAVASDLPSLEALAVPTKNSIVEDRDGTRLGTLTGSQNRILLTEDKIPRLIKQAIISVEDRRFYQNQGVDFRGTARALYQDILAGKVVQGGSTIAQQFVKNATATQDERTLLNKVREAALAFHMTRKWGRERILRNYLNTIYFGNGAYGVEAAARTYFGVFHPGCGKTQQRPCARELLPHEAALLAAVVASPGGYDPLTNPRASLERRNLVIRRMREQGYLDVVAYQDALRAPLPAEGDITPPREETKYPYFTSWVKRQVVEQLGGGQAGAQRAFEGNLRVRTTIDSRMQDAAQKAVNGWLQNPAGPQAALVALDNESGAVRAMIGGSENGFNARPFNLATQGQRQPGSAFKPFVLAQALDEGVGPGSLWNSGKQTIQIPNSSEKFEVNNYEDAYAGATTLARATTTSDNSVYAQVGIKVGTRDVARLARKLGIRTPVSTNYAMTLGGLREGVTPLDLARAYLAFPNDGKLVYGSMAPDADRYRGGVTNVPGPAGIDSITRRGDDEAIKLPNGRKARNTRRERRVLPEGVARQTAGILQTVVQAGTGQRANLGPGQLAAGKTGTTENYSDAWFVGWSKRYTVAVWVGYPEGFKPMKTEWRGEPVAGGTYPAAIWRDFMRAATAIDASRDPENKKDDSDGTTLDGGGLPAAPTTPAPDASAPPASESGSAGGDEDGTGAGETSPAPAPVAPEPEP